MYIRSIQPIEKNDKSEGKLLEKVCVCLSVHVREKEYDKHTITTSCSLFLRGIRVELSIQGFYC